jgi:hypothetical protein
MLNIMTLEAQLLAEIEERQLKLEKIRGVSPKVQALESLLKDCKATCDEFGMADLFTTLIQGFTAAPQPQNKTPKVTAPITPQQNTNTTPDPIQKLSDKETKALRIELKTFLEYEGQRLNDATAKNLLIEKLEALGKQDLLAEVNLDDKINFLTEAKKLIGLLTPVSDFKEEVKEEVKEEEALAFPVTTTVTVIDGVKALTPNLTVTVEEVKEEEALTPAPQLPELKEVPELKEEDVLKSALVQNLLNGFYGTVEQDGVLNGGALIRYPNTTQLTPLTELTLISPAIFTPKEVIPQDYSPQTPQELTMWESLIEIFESAEELIAMAQDKEVIKNFNQVNDTNHTTLPIPDLYEYATGNARIS